VAEPKHPLLLLPQPSEAAKAKRSGGPQNIAGPSRARQAERLQPRFERLEAAFDAQRVRLQEAVEGVAVEQVVVLEVAGGVQNFYNAVRRSGLHWLIDADADVAAPDDDFKLAEDAEAEVPNKLFLILTDQAAITHLLSLWTHYKESGQAAFKRGFTPWFHVFEQLRDVRLWDIRDRIEPDTRSYWLARLEAGDALIRTEIELWYSDSDPKNVEWSNSLRALLAKNGGSVIDTAEIRGIRYHAFLADLPAATIQNILEDENSPLAVAGQVMYYRPQFRAMARPGGTETSAFGQQRPVPTADPVVAILDGVPLQNHALLAQRIILDDPDNLQADASASDRVHGTSMASIVLHGDLNGQTPTIASRVVVHPILIPDPHSGDSPREEISPPDRLLLDVIHVGVKRLVEGGGGQPAVAPSIRVINLSIGDVKREFTRSISPLARLLDWLAWKYQLLFVVPAGNLASLGSGIELDVARADFSALSAEERAAAAFDAIELDTQFRRLLSPAESLNAITVGGVYADGSTFVATAGRFPLFTEAWPCPEGRCGPGFLKSVKPDLVAPSGRRLFSEKLGNTHANATLIPINVSSPPGILSASPSPVAGVLTQAKYSAGTSNAAALVSHATAHAYSALSALRETDPGTLQPRFDATLLKALTVHTCHWPESTTLQQVLVSANGNERKRRMSRLFGYGVLDIDRVRGSTDERATLIAVGDIAAEEGREYRVPLPPSLAAKKDWRRITITLAWLSPINPEHRDYRRAIMWFTCDRSTLKVSSAGADWQAMRRGSIQHDVWEGDKAAAYTDGAELRILVSCAADAGELLERVPYALCVSIEVAPGVELPIYQEIAARVAVPVSIPVT
jgi:subtilase family protein